MTLEELAAEVSAQKETIQHLLTKDRGQIVLSSTDDPPPDCLLCDGQVYDLQDPANEGLRPLFDLIGNRYGGDGVNTFAVPELRGEFIRVFDHGRGVDNGRALGSPQEEGTRMPAQAFTTGAAGRHSHDISIGDDTPDHSHGFGGYPYGVEYGGDNQAQNINTGVNGFYRHTDGANTRHRHPASLSECPDHTHPVAGGDAETRPRNIALAAFIRF